MRRKILIVAITLAMITPSVMQDGNCVNAEDDLKPDYNEASVEQIEDMDENNAVPNGYLPLDYTLNTGGISETNSQQVQLYGYPSAYDARENGGITTVKNQGGYGTCWAFAAINSAESDAVRDGRVGISEADYSEAQLAYFFYHRQADPLGGTTGDTVTTTENYLMVGGNNQLTTLALASWMSPTKESVMPYENVGSYNTSNVTANMAYPANEEHLQNAYWISISDQDSIKGMIIKYGSVATSYYSSYYYYYNNGNGYYYYCPTDYVQNHAISIVGWDDSIPASSFVYTDPSDGTQYMPSVDGGWLVKNSYGSAWGDNGYFWLSYGDASLTDGKNICVAYDYESNDNYDNNYQYDGTVGMSWLEYSTTSCYTANVFTSQGREELKATGFYTTQPGMSYEVQVYKNLQDGTPNGNAVFSTPICGTEPYAGYHTVEFPKSVSLNAGETYSIVVKYISPTVGTSFFIDSNITFGTITCTSNNQLGQGYYGWNGSDWKDCSTEHKANIRIKAFTDNYSGAETGEEVTIPIASISLNLSQCNMEIGDNVKLSATVLPANATENKTILWNSSNPAVATVDSTGNVVAYMAGTTMVTATTGNGLCATCMVTVTESTQDYTPTQAFVARLYNKCLERQPDEQGLSEWNQRLVSGEQSGAQVGYGFVFSPEYKGKHTTDSDYVEMLYRVFLDRASDPSGKESWMRILYQGASREYVFRGFVESQEYTQICSSYGINRGGYTLTQPRDENLGVTSFVARLYQQALGREFDVDGMNNWCYQINSRAMSPEEVAECFIYSQEFENKHMSDEEYVRTLYHTFLDREADTEGLNNWMGQLQRGTSRREILHGFSRSPEFKKIMAQYGL